MSVNQLAGYAALAIGLLDLAVYAAHIMGVKLPLSFWKLGPMQERWGKTAGTAVHFTGYVLAPIVLGLVLLRSGGA